MRQSTSTSFAMRATRLVRTRLAVLTTISIPLESSREIAMAVVGEGSGGLGGVGGRGGLEGSFGWTAWV